MNPSCPKCGKTMHIKLLLTTASVNENTGQTSYGLAKFWVCPNKSITHGTVKFKVGGQTIQ